MNDHPLWALSATELATGIRARRWTAVQVMTAHLDRAAETNPTLNALSLQWPDQALDEAATADARMRDGAPLGPLHGVPFTVKANIDVTGAPTTWGTRELAAAPSEVDAPAVANLRAAGAIPIAQTNMPDFAFRWATESSVAGTTRNPWNPDLTPGGSSGGAAVATAVGMAPVGLGNDAGGSLRQPAQCCGIVTLRPTTGRIPSVDTGPAPMLAIQNLNAQGPMARHISDLELLLPVLSRPDPRDPLRFPAPTATEAPRTFAVAPVPDADPAIGEALHRAATALIAAGYHQAETPPPDFTEAAELWHRLLTADIRHQRKNMEPLMCENGRTFLTSFLDSQPTPDCEQILAAYQERYAIAAQWSTFQERIPLILTPLSTRLPFTVGLDTDPGVIGDLLHSMRCIVTVNLLGLPACVVGTGVIGGLPQAVQLIAPRYREDLCLAAATSVEQQFGPAPMPTGWQPG